MYGDTWGGTLRMMSLSVHCFGTVRCVERRWDNWCPEVF